MTNGDWLRGLPDRDLAAIMVQSADLAEQIPFCQNLQECQRMLEGDEDIPLTKCEECVLAWLRKPVKEE